MHWASRAGTIRATVLIETILAAFEMDEILWELREHSAGLELRSVGLHFQLHQEVPQPCPDCVLPDRVAGHDGPAIFCASYVDLLIATCHRRGIHAMGGMAAQIPIKNNPEANGAALEPRARRQTARSLGRPRRHLGGASRAGSGRANAVFDTYMPFPNQIGPS